MAIEMNFNPERFYCHDASTLFDIGDIKRANQARLAHLNTLKKSPFGQKVARFISLQFSSHLNDLDNLLAETIHIAHQIQASRPYWAATDAPQDATKRVLRDYPTLAKCLRSASQAQEVEARSPRAKCIADNRLQVIVPPVKTLGDAYILFHELGHCAYEMGALASDLRLVIASEAQAIIFQRIYTQQLLLDPLQHSSFIEYERLNQIVIQYLMILEWAGLDDEDAACIQPALFHVPGYQMVCFLAEKAIGPIALGTLLSGKSALAERCDSELSRFFRL